MYENGTNTNRKLEVILIKELRIIISSKTFSLPRPEQGGWGLPLPHPSLLRPIRSFRLCPPLLPPQRRRQHQPCLPRILRRRFRLCPLQLCHQKLSLHLFLALQASAWVSAWAL